VPRHFARLVTRLVAPLVVDYSGLVVDYFSYAARLVTRLIAPLIVDYSASPRLVVDYSVRRDFVLRPRWLYFIHTVCRDYLSRGHTGSTSATPCIATTCLAAALALF
jgi:hypothetical protein